MNIPEVPEDDEIKTNTLYRDYREKRLFKVYAAYIEFNTEGMFEVRDSDYRAVFRDNEGVPLYHFFFDCGMPRKDMIQAVESLMLLFQSQGLLAKVKKPRPLRLPSWWGV